MKILGKDYLLVTLDFETFYATGYSLSALNTFAYVAADQFSIHGVGLKIEDEPTRWFNDTETALAWIDAKNTGSLPIALLCQNTYFDGWILHHHYDWHPDLYLDTMCMSRGLFPASSASLEKLCERLWPNDPKMRKGKELVQFKGTTTEHLYANQAALKTMVGYCIQDVELTYAAFIRMEPYYPDSELRLIDLTLRMMCEPLLRIDVPRVEDCLANAVAHRTKQIENSGYAESTLSSNAKFEALIRKLDLPVPLKDSPTAKEPDGVTPKKIAALGKADLGFQELRRNHPQFEHIWQGRIAAKSVGEITRAERFLDTARQCDGYMPVPLVYYSAHCVPGDTEVLTPDGWVAIQDWEGGLIAQVDTQQDIHFLEGRRFIGPTVDEWVVSDARYMPCAFTKGHTVPYLTHGSMQWGTLPAADAAARSSIYVPIAGQLQTRGAITPEQMRVLVMIQADGSFCEDTSQGRQLTIFVKRPRKIQRARELLQAAGVTYRELTFDSHPGYVRFTVAHRDYPDWLRPDRKVFGAWLLDSTPDAREAFTQELRHWDGCLNGGVQWSYSTSVRQNADWAVTLCHLTGRGASITTTAADNRGGYNRGENYTVNIRQRNYAQVKRTQWHLDHTPRATYCAKTITGYWLARANGRVFVTGNTGRYGGGEKLNLQNLGRTSELRRALCAQPGQMVYVADSSNIEARMLAWEAGQEDLLEIFRTGGDVYAYTAQDIYNRPIDKKKDPHERFIGKVTCLGADTRVITHRGIKRLVDVTTTDQLWDGSQWVNHDGLMYKGEKPTISICGVDMTPDHKTLCGTIWHEAETLARDASTLFRALETGAGALQSLATWSGNVGACEPSSCDATVLHPSTPSTRATTPGSRQPAATSVQSLPPASSDTGPTATQCPTMATEPDYSTDSQPQSAGAITHATRCSSPTDYGAFASTNPGETTAPVSLPTSRPSPDGTNPTWKWIELMLTGGMNLETSVSSPEPRTHATNAGSATSKPESGNSKPESDSSKSRMPVYDLLNAGPNHRFTILTDAGPMIVHNCLGLGYGMGWRKFQDTLAAGALGGPPVFMAEHEVRHIVNTFRTKRWAIKNYWQQADQAIVDMYMGNSRQWGPLTIHRNCIVMPNGMALQYPGLRPAEDDEFGGWEYHNGQFYTKIYGGKLTENITQALARIVLFDQMLAVEELFAPYGGRVVMNVHDEIIAVGPDLGVPEDQNELFQQMLGIMRTPPKWCPDLPLDGEGGVAAEYSK